MNFYSARATEKLYNNTVCIKEGEFIRNMKYEGDVNQNTVFVSNIIPIGIDQNEYTIQTLDYVRYMPISIVPKIQF